MTTATLTPELAQATWERILQRVERTSEGCLRWKGSTNSRGYGLISVGGRLFLIHRVALIVRDGSIPTGLVGDHTCHDPAICAGGNTCLHRRCVNPEHLEPVTSPENCRRGVQQNRSTCKRGHRLTVRHRGHKPVRCCRTCEAIDRHARRVVARSIEVASA